MEEVVLVEGVRMVLCVRAFEAAFVVDWLSLKTAKRGALELACEASACMRSRLDDMPAWGNMSWEE